MAYTNGDTLVRTVMTAWNGLVANEIVNDFAFAFTGGGIPVNADYDNLFNAVDGFYNDANGPNSVASFISQYVSRAATHKMSFYEITAPPMGSPVYELSWLGPAASGSPNGLPSECAAVLSFHADLTGVLEEEGVTRPKARRRGRVFIGPLNVLGVNQTTVPYLLSDAVTLAMRASAAAMAAEALAAGWTWSVWSRKDQLLRPVVAGWTDNAPDTQRRRGPVSSSRTVYSV